FGPADPQRRQVAQLVNRLTAGAVRMERLRGFGAALGTLATCACTRLDFADGEEGILIVATEPVGRPMPLVERLRRLVVDDTQTPVAAFESDGRFVAASPAAAALVGFQTLAEAGLDDARLVALREGRAETAFGSGWLTLHRVGRAADLGLLAFITRAEAQAHEAPSGPMPEYEPPHTPSDAAAISPSEDLAAEGSVSE